MTDGVTLTTESHFCRLNNVELKKATFWSLKTVEKAEQVLEAEAAAAFEAANRLAQPFLNQTESSEELRVE